MRSQEPVPPVGYLTLADSRARERLRAALLVDNPDLVEAGWLLAQNLGRTATPLLWSLLQDERPSRQRRLALLMAVALAGGPSEDGRILEYLDKAGKDDESVAERVLACMWIALGPERAKPVSNYWTRVLPKNREPHAILRVAAYLAAARLPGAAEEGRVAIEDDSGILASAAFAGIQIPESAANLRWNPAAPDRHAELFRRGALLGALHAGALQPEVKARLLARLRPFDADGQPASLRAAVALFRSRALDVSPKGPEPTWDLLRLFAADPESAERLEPWLRAEPPALADDPATLAVEYVLGRKPEQVVRERTTWAEKPAVRRHVAVALALHLLRRGERPVIDQPLPGVPEWFFVRWASGGPIQKDATIDDAELERAAQLAQEGRLPVEAARRVLEEALWRWGSHPGRGLFEAERLLIRDLMLTGSHPGSEFRPSVKVEQCYFATGIDANAPFFGVAIRAFKFLGRPTVPIPPGYRLR